MQISPKEALAREMHTHLPPFMLLRKHLAHSFSLQFHAALLQRWDLPEFMCQFCPTVAVLSVNISIFTLVAISLDR